MARGRILSKSLSCSRRFNALSDTQNGLAEFSQLLFALLIPHADDFGRMAGDPFSVKMTVLPASPRSLSEFCQAMRALHDLELITVYQRETSDIWIQINKFESHQSGLHKRTESQIPAPQRDGNSRKFPEIPGNSWSRARAEENRTEEKGRELKGTEEKGICTPPPEIITGVVAAKGGVGGDRKSSRSVNGRSKRPIFTGQRFVVFDWMLEDMRRILGPENLDKFDVHEWFFDLDARIAKVNVTLRREDVWPWLQSELVKESIKRQMPIAHPDLSVIPRLGKQTLRLMAAIASAKDTP